MRHHDWTDRLAAYLHDCRERPFAYGSNDCCWFAGNAVEAMTGVNPMMSFTYQGHIAAGRLIAEAGSLETLVRGALGEPLRSTALMGRGDIALATLEEGETVGVCVGRELMFCTKPAGITSRPREMARVAWRIG